MSIVHVLLCSSCTVNLWCFVWCSVCRCESFPAILSTCNCLLRLVQQQSEYRYVPGYKNTQCSRTDREDRAVSNAAVRTQKYVEISVRTAVFGVLCTVYVLLILVVAVLLVRGTWYLIAPIICTLVNITVQ